MPNKLYGEIEVKLMESIIKELPKLTAIHSTEHTILIHGMGSQSRGFYNELRQNKSVEVLWSDWCGKRWWTYIFSFIPGQAGLTKVIDRTQLDTLYEEIGSLSMCGLYFIPNNKVNTVLEEVKSKKLERTMEDLLINESNYFLLTVDFDYHGGERDGEIFYRQVAMGDNLDEEIKSVLKKQ